MNKKALKEFAVYARNELREQIVLRAQAFGVTSKGSPVLVTGADYVEINGNKYPVSYKNSIQKLLKEVETKGYDNVIEEVAYTWFNRLIAIRYMEVHNYLPSKVRVLSSETKGKVDPDILTDYQYTDLSVNKEELASLLAQGNREEAFRKLLVAQCNELNDIMPFLFEKLADYSELLLSESLLHADSLINKLGKELDDANFEHVEVIGWLYQYYISEKKDEVFAGLKKNKKIIKENIPAATQLFTPHWIVRYMVENSLGHMWLESHPQSELKEEMRYYVEPAEQEPEVQATIEELRNPSLSPEDITILDPACGSGHVLVYAFDLLYQIYEERGYPAKEIPFLILEKNLYGIDIDDRAAQLTSFSLMMKAREKTKRILRACPKLNIIAIKETNHLLIDQVSQYIAEGKEEITRLKELFELFKDAKNYGSILNVEELEFKKYLERIEQLEKSGEYTLETFEVHEQFKDIKNILVQAQIMATQYDIVITNPPYMGASGMNAKLSEYVKKYYNASKTDLFAVFMERCNRFTKKNGFHAEINQQSWMFLNSYENLRRSLLKNQTIYSMLHLGPRTFEEIGGEVVQSTSFVLRNISYPTYVTKFYRLLSYTKSLEKEAAFREQRHEYTVKQTNFDSIPGLPIAYWASKKVVDIFENTDNISKLGTLHEGIKTRDNPRFLRFWYEIRKDKFSMFSPIENAKWFPYSKGGRFRKWYGNNEYVINWEHEGKELREFKKSSGANSAGYCTPTLTWNALSSNNSLAFRLIDKSFWGGGGSGLTALKSDIIFYALGLLNSKVSSFLFNFFTATMNREVGQISKIPYLFLEDEKNHIEEIVKKCYEISRREWNSFETSWDFQKHPLLVYGNKADKLEECYMYWERDITNLLQQLKHYEEQLNKIFIEAYGIDKELDSKLQEEEITISHPDRMRDAKSFLSYCIGLMMGRYSLDIDGLVYAGGKWDVSKYKIFQPDKDGIIPLTNTEYFEDDVIRRLQELLVLMFGQDMLAENLRWLAESLTMKNNETPVERLRRYFFDDFYKDHYKIYQKRPIYWMVESGSKKGFRALFYMHRYTPETLATMRFSYVQNLQEKLCQEQKRFEQDLESLDITAAMKKRYNKQLAMIKAQQDELIDFDKKLAEIANKRVDLDLDSGVLVNYEQLQEILSNI